MAVKRENINIVPLKFLSLFLIMIGYCLYFTNLNSPIGAIRSYFLLGYTLLFLIFGISFSYYTYNGYKRFFLDYILKFLVYAAAYSIICSIVISIPVFTAKNNFMFLTNVMNAVNNTKFLFTNFWFIPTGLTVFLTLPFIDKLVKKFNYSLILFMVIILVIALNEVISPLVQNNGLHLRDIFSSLRYVLFYGLFTLIGLSHNELVKNREKNKITIFLFILVCFILITACLLIYGYSYDLIKHFYPPTFFLTVYHLLILVFFYAISFKLGNVSAFLDNKNLVKFTSENLLLLLFFLPLFLYLLSLLFNALTIVDFFNEHFIFGFLAYLISIILIWLLFNMVTNFFYKQKTNNQTY